MALGWWRSIYEMQYEMLRFLFEQLLSLSNQANPSVNGDCAKAHSLLLYVGQLGKVYEYFGYRL